MLVSPALPTSWDVAQGAQEPLMFLGFIKVAGYQGSVPPAFIIGIVGALLEKNTEMGPGSPGSNFNSFPDTARLFITGTIRDWSCIP